MAGAPEMLGTGRWEIANVTGDGAGDLVRVGHREIGLWVHWRARLAELEADEIVILSDVDGSGTFDLLRVEPTARSPFALCHPVARDLGSRRTCSSAPRRATSAWAVSGGERISDRQRPVVKPDKKVRNVINWRNSKSLHDLCAR